jgi:MraZ protein
LGKIFLFKCILYTEHLQINKIKLNYEKSGEKWWDVGKNIYLCNRFLYKDVRMRFLGNIEAKTDAKGRAFLPAIFRKVLQASGEENLVLRKDVFQKCLVLYPESVWNIRLDMLKNQLRPWKPTHQQMFRQFVSEAEVVSLDGNGRFLISKRLQKAAEIEQDIQFIGMDDTIEIWTPQNLKLTLKSEEDFGSEFELIMNSDTTL